MSFQAVYVPIGVGTFHLESAQAEFEKSIQMLASLTEEVVCPEKMLLTLPDLAAYLDGLDPDLILLQNITFANAAYATEVLKRFRCPLLLWTLREPVIDGGRLRLNSLTGAYSAANAIRAFRGGTFEYVFGSPEESKAEIAGAVRAAKVLHDLKGLKLASIGHTPQGFGFGRAMDAELASRFGVTLESIEVRELIDQARRYSDEECQADLEEAKKTLRGLEATPEKNVRDFARLYKAYKSYIQENGIGAISSRCWPDLFTSYGTPVCAVLSLLNDAGVAASCESDAYGALSMYIGAKLSGGPVFFGDPVSMDEQENTVTYWHCGMAACSLAQEEPGPQVGVHPNRRLGPAMDFGCKASGAATIFRVGRKPDGTFRFFIAEGRAVAKPKQFCGTSVVVETANSARELVCGSVKDGWEPHFAVIYAGVKDELIRLAHMLDMEVCLY